MQYFLLQVSSQSSVPICVDGNPATTHYHPTDHLYQQLAEIPRMRCSKIPSIAADMTAKQRLTDPQEKLPADVSIGISGDSFAATFLSSGGTLCYSVIVGLFPQLPRQLYDVATDHYTEKLAIINHRIQPFWELFGGYAVSMRILAAAASLLKFTVEDNLPRPLQPLNLAAMQEISRAVQQTAAE